MKPKLLILIFALLKLIIHLVFNTQYGLHRDEYLYFMEGQHLGWGYMEGPPMIGLLAALANLFGPSELMLRLFPSLAGVASLLLIGSLVLELGGKKWAITFSSLAFILSPVYLRANLLFQPVSFNQFFWLATLYVVVLILKRNDGKLWFLLGAIIGLGLMTKYSLLFLLLPLVVMSIVLKETRTWYSTKYPYIAGLIALLIVLPNVIWQYNHHFPVLVHMEDLTNSQLVNVSAFAFIRDQFLHHLSNSIIWVSGLLLIMFSKEFKDYRLIGWSYFGVLVILILLSGKSYYSMGIYSTLFVFGGIALERWIQRPFYKQALAFFMVISLLPFIPYALPVLKVSDLETYCAYMDEHTGMDAPIIWEDGNKYPIPQDYADMRGWEDMVRRVAEVYHRLTPEEQADCNIWGGGYGHAGAINFYRQKYDLPEAVSLSASFLIWCPDEQDFSVQIVVDDRWQTGSEIFDEFTFIDSSEVYLARDPGYIYLKKRPNGSIPEIWKENIAAAKETFNF